MNDDDPSTSATAAGMPRVLSRIALEIVIGFVGVYAAFALSAYKERRDLIDRRHQIKRALIAEIGPMVQLAKHNHNGYRAFLLAFDSSVKAGRPAPHPFIETVNLADHVWEATKQAGGLNLIDVPTFVELSAFYNENAQMYAQYAQLREFSLREIIPRLGAGPNAFYEPGTKTLRAEFHVYETALGRIEGLNQSVMVGGDTLLSRLAHDTT
jgi:hypothetical protein